MVRMKCRFRYMGLGVLLFLVLSPAVSCSVDNSGKPDRNGEMETVVVKIGDLSLSLLEVQWIFESIYEKHPPSVDDNRSAMITALEALANEMIFYQQALAAGIHRDSVLQARVSMINKQFIADKYLKSVLNSEAANRIRNVDIQDREPLSYEMVEVHQITLPSKEAAETARKWILNGDDFSELAKEISIDPSGPAGGKVNMKFIRGAYPIFSEEVHESIFSYKKNDITEPLDTEMGWTIFRIDNREDLSAKVTSSIKERIRHDLVNEQISEMKESIYLKFPLKLDQEALEKALFQGEGGTPDSGVVGKIGDREVSFLEVKAYLEWTNSREPDSLEGWISTVEDMSSNVSLYAEAMEKGFGSSYEIVKLLEYFYQQEVRKAYAQSLEESTVVQDKDVWERYLESSGARLDPDSTDWYRLAKLVAKNKDAAEKAVVDLKTGKAWEEVYLKYNSDAKLPDNGTLGMVTISDLSWEEYAVISGTQPGSPSLPIISEGGTAVVFLVEKRIDGRGAGFDELEKSSRDEIFTERMEEVYKKLYEEGVKRYPVEILDHDLLNKNVTKWIAKLKEKSDKRRLRGGNSGSFDPHKPNPHSDSDPRLEQEGN